MRPDKNESVRALVVSPEDKGLKLDGLLKRKAVAELLGVSTATLKTWVCERRGPHFFKMGRGRGSRVYYRREDIESWLNREAVRVEMKS